MIITTITIIHSTVAAWLYWSRFMYWTSRKPTPPPPTSPSTVDMRTLWSHQKMVTARNSGMTWGTTAASTVWRRLAPVAVIASTGPGSMLSIASEYNLPREPMEGTTMASTP